VGFLIFLLIISVICVLGFWLVRVQNKLVHSDELCSNSLSQIGIQQQSRWDALSSLADLTKGYSSHENDTLSKVVAARKSIAEVNTAGDVQSQERLLTKGFASINVLAEAYPELKANTIYIKTMDSVNNYENNVRMSRMVYNDTVTKFNRMVRSFPGSVIAGMLKFKSKSYLETDSQNQSVPSFK
jgi:LemA protein